MIVHLHCRARIQYLRTQRTARRNSVIARGSGGGGTAHCDGGNGDEPPGVEAGGITIDL